MSAYVINRWPTTALKDHKTPYEAFTGRKPDYKNLHVFGCIAYAKTLPGNKLAHRSEKCIFLGYVPNGYKLWSLQHNRPICARDVVFDDTKFFKDLTKEEKSKILTGTPVLNTTSQIGNTNITNPIHTQLPQLQAGVTGTNNRILNH